MKLQPIIVFIIISLLSISCSESPTNNSSGTPFAYDISLFVSGTMQIVVPLNKSIVNDSYVTIDDNNYQYFGVSGLHFTDTSNTKLIMSFYGYKITSSPVSKTIVIRCGSDIIYVPVKVTVSDFYYASQMFTNAPDTIMLKKGTNFLLKIGFKDTLGNIVSKRRIESMLNSYSYSINSNSGEKVLYYNYWQDTTHFAFMLSAFQDITPSVQDTGMFFSLYLSNKSVKVPIKLTY